LEGHILQPQNTKISAQFQTTSWLDREYHWTGRRYRWSENSTANHDHSHACTALLIWWTLVHKWRKMGPKWTFSDVHIWGAKVWCPLKIYQIAEDEQRLLMHTHSDISFPPTFFSDQNSNIGQKFSAFWIISSRFYRGITLNFFMW